MTTRYLRLVIVHIRAIKLHLTLVQTDLFIEYKLANEVGKVGMKAKYREKSLRIHCYE